MKSLVEHLACPQLVAHFQQLCGVEWTNSDGKKKAEESQATNHDYVIKNKIIYQVFRLGSEMAGEPFYYIMLPVCGWMLDIGVARKTLMQLTMAMYIGQSMKDLLKHDRPASPPVIRLEKMYETEYGMPSTHAITGSVAPFALFLFSREVYEIDNAKCIVAASLWSAWVSTSRVYMGMHTVWQVIMGLAVTGTLVQPMVIEAVTKVEQKLVSSSTLTGLSVLGGVALAHVMFQFDTGLDPVTKQPRWNTSRGDTAALLGLCTGFLSGSHISILQQFYQHRPVGNILLPVPIAGLRKEIVRFTAGIAITFTLVRVYKKLSALCLTKISGTSFKDNRKVKNNPKVEMAYHHSSGFVAGFTVAAIVPFVLSKYSFW